mmetsp:Transcript_52643/g.138256  ORF Transcript_52643/g.138256 Transcript_52643/m.138256 type:complete len:235 (-) Transcript_52643:2582-3286(-)
MAGPSVSAIGKAQGAAARMYAVVDRQPPIDIQRTDGIKPDIATFRGRIEFRDVWFAYPSRPDTMVLRGVSVVIEAGAKVALVGGSGSGKSTLLQLAMRLYDPLRGEVLLDGVDVRRLDVAWLRSHFGVVNQEPQLFDLTILENIAISGGIAKTVNNAEVEGAARAAAAHEFITNLPEGYNTRAAAGQLSGGQKQRIAIARAVGRPTSAFPLIDSGTALEASVCPLVVIDRIGFT